MRISDWSSDVCASDLPVTSRGPLSISLLPQRLADACAASAIRGQDLRRLTIGASCECARVPPDEAGVEGAVPATHRRRTKKREIGRASCRERVLKSLYLRVAAVSIKNNNEKQQ